MGLNYLWRFTQTNSTRSGYQILAQVTGIRGLLHSAGGAELVHAIEIDDGTLHS